MKKLDSRQRELKQVLDGVALAIKPVGLLSSIKHLFGKTQLPKGVYLYGGVGRGKTMLMKIFYEKILVSKEIIHFQKFMQTLHLQIHQLRKSSVNRVVEELAADIAKRAKVICMDEFEIKDITDAMLIMQLFEYLGKMGVFIFITSNTPPDNLYKDGLQREAFLPFIEDVENNFTILHLDTNKDYRYALLSSIEDRILYPISNQSFLQMQKIKHELCEEDELLQIAIKVFGRQISFQQAYQNILFTNFDELLVRNLGYADYVSICENFKIIVLESVKQIAENESDIITRFINFIDNAYFYKVLLFIELELPPIQIYPKGKKLAEFSRTVSRLNEMNSKEYLGDNV